MKRDKPKDNITKQNQNSPQIIKQMTKEQVMSQIGMSLLIESPHSYISPVVAGILCLKSEVMPYFQTSLTIVHKYCNS